MPRVGSIARSPESMADIGSGRLPAMVRSRAWLAVLCLPFVAAPRAQDVPAPERFHAARETIRQRQALSGAPALSLAVVQDGELVWAEGFGTADREADRAATADTIYRLASISKPFTATAVMRLVERGALELDALANRWLGDAPLRALRGSADGITLRRLLDHTAGLPTHWNFFYAGETPPPRERSIAAYGFACWQPGTRTNYSNFGFGVLDHVVARAAGTTFREFLVREVLDPLGMTHSDLGVRPGCEEFAAAGYARHGDRWERVRDYGFDHDGASAVRSSARDLMRFAMLQIGEGTVDGAQVLQRESALAMRQRRGEAARSNFGIGWDIGQVRGKLVLRHTGGMPGVSTALQVFPGERAAFCVLTNGGDRALTNHAVGVLLDAVLGKAPPAPARATVDGAGAPPARAENERAPERAPEPGRWRGSIAHPDGAIAVECTVTAEATTLRIGDGEPVAARRSTVRDGVWSVQCAHALALHHDDPRTPVLEFELERADAAEDSDGAPAGERLLGVVYATVDGLCRLPFAIGLRRVGE